jgi:hypothetical protein
VVEPLIGASVPLPPALAELMARPRHFVDIGPDDATLKELVAGPPA